MTRPAIFRCFKTSPEIIRLAVMLDVPYPLSLRNVGDQPHERGIDITHETVRFWWNRFGTVFAAGIRPNSVRAMLRFRRMRSLQKFAAVHGKVHNHFSQERTRISRRNFAPRTFGSRIDAPPRWPHGVNSAGPEQGRVGAISETVLIRLTAPAAGRNAGAAAQATKPLSD